MFVLNVNFLVVASHLHQQEKSFNCILMPGRLFSGWANMVSNNDAPCDRNGMTSILRSQVKRSVLCVWLSPHTRSDSSQIEKFLYIHSGKMKNKAGVVGPKGAHHIKPFLLFSFFVPLVMLAWCGLARSRGLFLLVWQLQRISLVKVSQSQLLLNRASSI